MQSKAHIMRDMIKWLLIYASLGLLYLVFFRKFNIGIPCIINKITGLKCPGCGMTHAIAALSRGDIYGAIENNVLSVTMLPILCIYLFYRILREKMKGDETFYIWEYVFLMVMVIVAIYYTYLRNESIIGGKVDVLFKMWVPH